MKNFKTIIPFLFVLCLLVMAGCGSDDGGDTPEPEKTEEQKQTEKLTKTWAPGSVTLEGNEVDYGDFTLTVSANEDGSNKAFATTFGQSAWPASGTWSFVEGTDFKTIKRSDGIEVSISNLTASAVTLTFTIPSEGSRINQKVKGTSGEFVFNLVAQ